VPNQVYSEEVTNSHFMCFVFILSWFA